MEEQLVTYSTNEWYLQEYISYEKALEKGLFETLKL